MNIHQNERIHSFDLLRGFFIILALQQHFAYYLNFWYVDFFKNISELASIYNVHTPFIGKKLPVDTITYIMAYVFTPWVSQIYLTLAAFNLAKRSHHDFKFVFTTKVKIFGVLLLLFIFENFLVSPNFGEAISFYPIMGWMVILSLVAIVFRYFDFRGVIALTIASILIRFTGIDNLFDVFEKFIASNIHGEFEYDARLTYFLPSACVGFLLGHLYHIKKNIWTKCTWPLFFTSLAFLAGYFIFEQDYSILKTNLFKTEHDLSYTVLGSIAILAAQILVVQGGVFIHLKKWDLNPLKFLQWVGIHSLSIFYIHRILFIYLLMPIRELLGSLFVYPVQNSTLEIYICIVIVCVINLLILKLKPYKLLWGSN